MLRFFGSVTGLALLMVACSGGGGGGGGVSAPSGLHYFDNPQWLTVGEPYSTGPATVTGTVTGYSVRPALPAGLSIDPASGEIFGTPLTASPETIYTITASNHGGAAKFALTMAVFVPPSALTYPSPVYGTASVAFSLVPTYNGDANGFAISPELPAGLGIDSTTGIVSGTPTSTRNPVTYTVFAQNPTGAHTTTDLLLAVDPPPPGTVVTGVFRNSIVTGLGFVSGAQSGVTNDSGEFTYETGLGITFSVGQVSIGAIPIAKSLITPVDLVAHGTGTSNHVLNVVRFLMMLDQDGNPSNGIQISEAVTAAAAGWSPVDFDTTDLPTALGPLIQQASTADGAPHALPDAASAQTRLRAEFYCTYSGRYTGYYAGASNPGERGPFEVFFSSDGSARAIAHSTATLSGFEVVTVNALDPLFDASFALSSQNPSIDLQGSFPDLTYLSGTYLGDAAGTFVAIGYTGTAWKYKFVGHYGDGVVLGMDNWNQVSGLGHLNSLEGTVTGTTFVGTILVRDTRYPYHGLVLVRFPVTGIFGNSDLGYTLDGQYTAFDVLHTFSTVGCRVN